MQKYKDYVEQIPQRSYQKPSYQKPLRKRKHYQPADEESEESELSQKLGEGGRKNKQKEK